MVGNDVTSTILEVLNNEFDHAFLNHAFIVLILKVNNTKLCTQCRPINLCNVIFKLSTKLVANRLKLFLAYRIHETYLSLVN